MYIYNVLIIIVNFVIILLMNFKVRFGKTLIVFRMQQIAPVLIVAQWFDYLLQVPSLGFEGWWAEREQRDWYEIMRYSKIPLFLFGNFTFFFFPPSNPFLIVIDQVYLTG